MKSTFTGEYQHSIDAKGRVIVPAKFRESLGETFMITMGYDGCLSMYSNDEWIEFVEKLNKLPEGRKEARIVRRHFLAKAVLCEMDKQGRVLIPAKLREYAEFVKDIVFVGMLSKVEIWSKEKWDDIDLDNMDDAAEKLAEFGIEL